MSVSGLAGGARLEWTRLRCACPSGDGPDEPRRTVACSELSPANLVPAGSAVADVEQGHGGAAAGPQRDSGATRLPAAQH
jgi:hypothetical protein